MVNEDLSRYLWKGLNLKRYSVVRIIPQDAKYTFKKEKISSLKLARSVINALLVTAFRNQALRR